MIASSLSGRSLDNYGDVVVVNIRGAGSSASRGRCQLQRYTAGNICRDIARSKLKSVHTFGSAFRARGPPPRITELDAPPPLSSVKNSANATPPSARMPRAEKVIVAVCPIAAGVRFACLMMEADGRTVLFRRPAYVPDLGFVVTTVCSFGSDTRREQGPI